MITRRCPSRRQRRWCRASTWRTTWSTRRASWGWTTTGRSPDRSPARGRRPGNEMWVLALPAPGAAGGLRAGGPDRDALAVGEVVVAGGLVLRWSPIGRAGGAVAGVAPSGRPRRPARRRRMRPERDGDRCRRGPGPAGGGGGIRRPGRCGCDGTGLSTRQQARIDRALRLLEACTWRWSPTGPRSRHGSRGRSVSCTGSGPPLSAALCATATWAVIRERACELTSKQQHCERGQRAQARRTVSELASPRSHNAQRQHCDAANERKRGDR